MSSGAVQKQRQASGREDDTAYLHRAERPWLPKHRLRGSSEETDRRELIGRFRAILNKVTVQTLEVLAQQARGLEVKGEEDLRGMVDLLHSQAVEAPVGFVGVYARLSKLLSSLQAEDKVIPCDTSPSDNFRRLLLTHCQLMFERRNVPEAFEELTKTDGVHDQSQSQIEDHRRMRRRKAVGNMCFIGELFQLKMISERIIYACLDALLEGILSEEQLECFTYLIAIVGKDLTHSQPERMSVYFMRVEEVIGKGETSVRIKFRLMDIRDMKASNWTFCPLWLGESPKKIDQI